ncbi:NUDIX hydrolase domain-like protein [Sporodiniella umbellata]|nr:NUDIX hydrolase domain-like protein [Sporodiniella umbellata]
MSFESTTEIDCKKNKARHGHGQDVKDIYNTRQVAGCLPVDPIEQKILLVSSRKHPGAWVIPKGGWEQDETQEHAALRETWEEAGIKGHIVHHLGVFPERCKKKGIKAQHWIYELHVEKVKKKYPERNKRERQWFTFEEAIKATKDNEYIQSAILICSLSQSPNL